MYLYFDFTALITFNFTTMNEIDNSIQFRLLKIKQAVNGCYDDNFPDYNVLSSWNWNKRTNHTFGLKQGIYDSDHFMEGQKLL